MYNESGERGAPLGGGASVKRRGLFKLGALATAATGAFAVSGLEAGPAQANGQSLAPTGLSISDLSATYVRKDEFFVNALDYATVPAAYSALTALGGGILYLPEGVWTIGADITFAGTVPVSVVGSGPGTVINFTAGTTSALRVSSTAALHVFRDFALNVVPANVKAISIGKPGCLVENVAVTGGSIGINVSGSTVRRCTVTGAAKDGIATDSDNAVVEDCIVTGCGDGSVTNQGAINVYGGDNVRIRRNRTESNGSHGIYMANCTNIEVSNNISRLNGALQRLGGRGITVGGPCSNVKILNNTMEQNTESAIIVPASTTNYLIDGNIAANNNTGGFVGGHGIEVGGSHGVISGNICYGNNCGISCNSGDQVITGNKCYNNIGNFAVGIKLYNAPRTIVSGNICTGNASHGIDVNGDANFSGPTITGNCCTDNVGKGISISNKSQNIILMNNKALNNTGGDITCSDNAAVRAANLISSDSGASGGWLKPLAYSTSITWNGEASTLGTVSVTDARPFTINSPSTAFSGRQITFEIFNNTAGAMGTITWASAFSLGSPFVNPPAGGRTFITFVYEAFYAKWFEISRSR
ncbi:right-handed parallel beta-helix repeat-containing protein [Arthrobacter sp. M-10]|uniref:right-handed parallel beta-helix repeat-containing protein n=1 Tax=Arthrobacter sp. M-10 TaxID=3233037 RepID=UPI003F934AED